MKLEEGMYVRTKYGIFKIRKITKDLAYWKREKRVLELDRNIPECNYRFLFYKDESIFKGAKFKDNITDLIEVGDYVNGFKVDRVEEVPNKEIGKVVVLDCGNVWGWEYEPVDIYKDEIKTILTKEQFESMSYKLW